MTFDPKNTETAVSREFKPKAGEPVETHTNPEPAPMHGNEYARVAVEIGATLSIGNYESVRYSVRVEMPCKPAEVPEARAFVHGVAQEAYEREVEGVRAFVIESRAKAAVAINAPANAKKW